MRFLLTTKQDMQYQMRYGFYFIYGILTLFYVLILSQINDPVLRSLTGSLIILGDPAVLGYFLLVEYGCLNKKKTCTVIWQSLL